MKTLALGLLALRALVLAQESCSEEATTCANQAKDSARCDEGDDQQKLQCSFYRSFAILGCWQNLCPTDGSIATAQANLNAICSELGKEGCGPTSAVNVPSAASTTDSAASTSAASSASESSSSSSASSSSSSSSESSASASSSSAASSSASTTLTTIPASTTTYISVSGSVTTTVASTISASVSSGTVSSRADNSAAGLAFAPPFLGGGLVVSGALALVAGAFALL